jgi:murein DD-endopeptidase MepM/ murein hydrolase activator NlpD
MSQPARDDGRVPAGADAAERAARVARRERRRRARAQAQRLSAASAPAAPPSAPSPAPRQGPSPRLVPAPKPRRSRAPALKAAPAPPSPPPPRITPTGSLRWPTLKVAVALAITTALAAGAGKLIGLPVPPLDEGSGNQASAISTGEAALLSFGEGTPLGLSKGPFFPLAGEVGFGEADAKFHADRGGRLHEGQDMFAKRGTPLVSVRDGVVVDGGSTKHPDAGGRGNWVVVYSPLDDRSYVYLHLLEPPLVKVGDQVQAGQAVGKLGCTGSCWGPHLHFEIRNGRASPRSKTKAVDPLAVIKQWPQVPSSPEARR